MTSAIPVQRSTNWANKPTGSWSMNWVQINIQVNEDFRYMKIHIFALRWRDEIKRSSQLRTLLKRVVENRTWKKFRPVRDLNPRNYCYRIDYYRNKREICFILVTNFPGMLPVCYDVIYSTQFSKYQTWALFWRLSTQGKDKYGRNFVKKTSNQWRHTLADRSMVNSNPEWTISFSFAP